MSPRKRGTTNHWFISQEKELEQRKQEKMLDDLRKKREKARGQGREQGIER